MTPLLSRSAWLFRLAFSVAGVTVVVTQNLVGAVVLVAVAVVAAGRL